MSVVLSVNNKAARCCCVKTEGCATPPFPGSGAHRNVVIMPQSLKSDGHVPRSLRKRLRCVCANTERERSNEKESETDEERQLQLQHDRDAKYANTPRRNRLRSQTSAATIQDAKHTKTSFSTEGQRQARIQFERRRLSYETSTQLNGTTTIQLFFLGWTSVFKRSRESYTYAFCGGELYCQVRIIQGVIVTINRLIEYNLLIQVLISENRHVSKTTYKSTYRQTITWNGIF